MATQSMVIFQFHRFLYLILAQHFKFVIVLQYILFCVSFFLWSKWSKYTLAHYVIIKFSKPLTTATFTLHRVFYCVARTLVVIDCQRNLLLLGWHLWMNLRRTRCKLRLSKDALVKGLQNLIIKENLYSCNSWHPHFAQMVLLSQNWNSKMVLLMITLNHGHAIRIVAKHEHSFRQKSLF